MISPTLSVLTATKNCAGLIGNLISSLHDQSDVDFTWIVADSRSSDGTLDLITESGLPEVRISSKLDFSIYDALNRAIRICKSDYYLVLGADDFIHRDTVANYRQVAGDTWADVVVAAVQTYGKVKQPLEGKPWLRGGNAFTASHSVGTLIRRDIHDHLGLYSNRYVNAADMHFILKIAQDPAFRLVAAPFVAGHFSNDGISSVDEIASLNDFFRLQLAFGENAAVQLGLHTLRLIRACSRLSRVRR